MSAISGLASKGDTKSTAKDKKFSALDINKAFVGKSIETTKTSAQPKHGLQTLGKVTSTRRVAAAVTPQPLNSSDLPTITPNTTTAQNTVNQAGWTAKQVAEEVSSTSVISNSSNGVLLSEKRAVTQTSYSVQSVTAANPPTGLSSAENWNGGQRYNSLPTSNYGSASRRQPYPQDFPQLSGGPVGQEASVKAKPIEVSGPSLRPQTEGKWIKGTAGQGSQHQNNGNDVNGHSAESRPNQTAVLSVPEGNKASNQTNQRAKFTESRLREAPAIVTGEALNDFDKILQSEVVPKIDWLTKSGAINYDEKLNFSDEEEPTESFEKVKAILKHDSKTDSDMSDTAPSLKAGKDDVLKDSHGNTSSSKTADGPVRIEKRQMSDSYDTRGSINFLGPKTSELHSNRDAGYRNMNRERDNRYPVSSDRRSDRFTSKDAPRHSVKSFSRPDDRDADSAYRDHRIGLEASNGKSKSTEYIGKDQKRDLYPVDSRRDKRAVEVSKDRPRTNVDSSDNVRDSKVIVSKVTESIKETRIVTTESVQHERDRKSSQSESTKDRKTYDRVPERERRQVGLGIKDHKSYVSTDSYEQKSRRKDSDYDERERRNSSGDKKMENLTKRPIKIIKEPLRPDRSLRDNKNQLPPRLAKLKELNSKQTGSNLVSLNAEKAKEPVETTKPTQAATVSSQSHSSVTNAWTKPLPHTPVQAALVSEKTVEKELPQPQIKSKSASIEQDNVSDLSGHSSSSRPLSQKPATMPVEKVGISSAKISPPSHAVVQAPVSKIIDTADTIDDVLKLSGTVIFENKNFKAENAALDMACGKRPNIKELSRGMSGNHFDAKSESSKAAMKVDLGMKDSESGLALDMKKAADANSTANVQTHDLEMRMASVKRVWDNSTVDSAATDDKAALNLAMSSSYPSEPTNSLSPPRTVTAPSLTPGHGAKVAYSGVDVMTKMPNKPLVQYPAAHQGLMSSNSPPVATNHQMSSPPIDAMRQLNAYVQGGNGSNQQGQLYGSQGSVGAQAQPQPALYQHFGQQLDHGLHPHLMSTMFAQTAPVNANHGYASHMMQQNNHTSMYLRSQPAVQAPNDYRANAAALQQNLAASQLRSQFQQMQGALHAMQTQNAAAYYSQNAAAAAGQTATGFYQTPGTPMQQQQATVAAAGYGYSTPANPSAIQQAYRAVQQQMPTASHPANVVDSSNGSSAMRSLQGQLLPNSGYQTQAHLTDYKYLQQSQQMVSNAQRAIGNQAKNYSYAMPAASLQQQQQMTAAVQKFHSQQQQQQQQQQQAVARQPLLYPHMANHQMVNGANQRPITGGVPHAIPQQQMAAYPQPIQRPNQTMVQQGQYISAPNQQPKPIAKPPQMAQAAPVMAATNPNTGRAITSQQKSKMREDALKQTQSFFAQSKRPDVTGDVDVDLKQMTIGEFNASDVCEVATGSTVNADETSN
ncbi:hypothetical protein HDE_07994 [Halotydeus destructor]|nr:hypothetical protein HDE_07994 [Halotydeus destructor]